MVPLAPVVMKKYLSLMLVSLFLLASQQSSAGSITCGSYMIEDGQINGQSREEVEEKCGVPDDRSGNDYFYKQENVTYRLPGAVEDRHDAVAPLDETAGVRISQLRAVAHLAVGGLHQQCFTAMQDSGFAENSRRSRLTGINPLPCCLHADKPDGFVIQIMIKLIAIHFNFISLDSSSLKRMR